jgi:hypothetical protein
MILSRAGTGGEVKKKKEGRSSKSLFLEQGWSVPPNHSESASATGGGGF